MGSGRSPYRKKNHRGSALGELRGLYIEKTVAINDRRNPFCLLVVIRKEGSHVRHENDAVSHVFGADWTIKEMLFELVAFRIRKLSKQVPLGSHHLDCELMFHQSDGAWYLRGRHRSNAP